MKRYKLKDVALNKLEYGAGAAACEYDGCTRYIRITDIDDEGVLGTDIVSPNSIDEKYLLQDGDVLFARTGNTVGKTFRYRSTDGRCVYAGFLIRVVPNQEIIRPDYLFYYTKSPQYKRFVQSSMKVVAQPNINAKQYGGLEFNVPSLNEQDNILARLNRLSSIITKRRFELKKLDELIKARFVELFGDAVNNDRGWETASVESVCKEIFGGGTPSKSHPEYYENGDIPWVSSKDMKTDVLYDSQIRINQLGVDNSTARMVPVNSVIMVIRSGILKHTLPVAINAVPLTVNQDLKVFVPGDKIITRFLAMQFKMHEKDILSGVRAVTADNIEFNSLKQRLLIIPPIELQKEFVSFSEQVDKSKTEVQKALSAAQTLFNSLMQQYFG